MVGGDCLALHHRNAGDCPRGLCPSRGRGRAGSPGGCPRRLLDGLASPPGHGPAPRGDREHDGRLDEVDTQVVHEAVARRDVALRQLAPHAQIVPADQRSEQRARQVLRRDDARDHPRPQRQAEARVPRRLRHPVLAGLPLARMASTSPRASTMAGAGVAVAALLAVGEAAPHGRGGSGGRPGSPVRAWHLLKVHNRFREFSRGRRSPGVAEWTPRQPSSPRPPPLLGAVARARRGAGSRQRPFAGGAHELAQHDGGFRRPGAAPASGASSFRYRRSAPGGRARAAGASPRTPRCRPPSPRRRSRARARIVLSRAPPRGVDNWRRRLLTY